MFVAVGKVCLSFDVSQQQHLIKDTSNLPYDLNEITLIHTRTHAHTHRICTYIVMYVPMCVRTGCV